MGKDDGFAVLATGMFLGAFTAFMWVAIIAWLWR